MLPPSPKFLDLTILANEVNSIVVELEFTPGAVNMISAPNPDPSHWTMHVDGIEIDVDGCSWGSPNILNIDSIDTAVALVDIKVTLFEYGVNVRNLDGVHAPYPQDITVKVP